MIDQTANETGASSAQNESQDTGEMFEFEEENEELFLMSESTKGTGNNN